MKSLGSVLTADPGRIVSRPTATTAATTRCRAMRNGTTLCLTEAEWGAYREVHRDGQRVGQLGMCRDVATGEWVYAEPRVSGDDVIERSRRDRAQMARCRRAAPEAGKRSWE